MWKNMRNRIVIAFVFVAGLLAAAALGNAAAQTPADSPVAGDALKKPKLPDVGLAPVSGFDDDAAYVRSVSDRVASIEASAAREDLALRRAATLLSGANLILARQIEPACSRRLLRIDGGDGDGGGLRGALDHADELLARAEALLKESAEASETRAERHEVARHHKTLQAFAAGLRAYLLPGTDDASLSGIRRAVSLLAPLIEDEERSVSAAARLWQACLRSGESDIPRALSTLDLAVTKPAEGAMPYALFASVERCRLLAMRGGQATALALLMQVEGRCEEWTGRTGLPVGETESRARAIRMVQLAQMQILGDWYDGVGSDIADTGRPAAETRIERRWCADRISKLTEEGFGGDEEGLFRLSEAIPIIAKPPASGKEADEG